MKKKNKSGSIKPAPMSLMKLKESIDKVPFKLQTPSMSGVVNSGNMMKGVQKAAAMLGGLNEVGEFKNILNLDPTLRPKVNLQSNSVGGSIPDEVINQLAAQVSSDNLEAAMGGASALGLSLMAYLDDEDVRDVLRQGPPEANTEGLVPNTVVNIASGGGSTSR